MLVMLSEKYGQCSKHLDWLYWEYGRGSGDIGRHDEWRGLEGRHFESQSHVVRLLYCFVAKELDKISCTR
jgi:hypothetical protein